MADTGLGFAGGGGLSLIVVRVTSPAKASLSTSPTFNARGRLCQRSLTGLREDHLTRWPKFGDGQLWLNAGVSRGAQCNGHQGFCECHVMNMHACICLLN